LKIPFKSKKRNAHKTGPHAPHRKELSIWESQTEKDTIGEKRDFREKPPSQLVEGLKKGDVRRQKSCWRKVPMFMKKREGWWQSREGEGDPKGNGPGTNEETPNKDMDTGEIKQAIQLGEMLKLGEHRGGRALTATGDVKKKRRGAGLRGEAKKKLERGKKSRENKEFAQKKRHKITGGKEGGAPQDGSKRCGREGESGRRGSWR